jgi:hypothetical protein
MGVKKTLTTKPCRFLVSVSREHGAIAATALGEEYKIVATFGLKLDLFFSRCMVKTAFATSSRTMQAWDPLLIADR